MNEETVEWRRIRSEKPTRTRIRLKHPLTADVEITTSLPDSLKEFEEALARGGVEALRASLAATDALME